MQKFKEYRSQSYITFKVEFGSYADSVISN